MLLLKRLIKKINTFWLKIQQQLAFLWSTIWPLSIRNVTLKLVALLIASVLWGFVVSQQRGQSSDIVFTSSVVLKNIPEELQVLSSNVQSASVLINLAPGLAGSINPALFQIIVDLNQSERGFLDRHITPQSLVYNNNPLPKDIRVLRITPNRIRVRLAESIEHLVKISPRLSGTPAKGFTVISTKLKPETITLSGPRSTLEKLNQVFTLPININNLTDHNDTDVELQLPQYVRLAKEAPQTIRVRVLISEKPIRRLELAIPVVFDNNDPDLQYKYSINQVNAYLMGTENAFENWDSSKVYAVLDLKSYQPGDYRGLKPSIQLPNNISVLEQWPIVDLFVINRSTSNSKNK